MAQPSNTRWMAGCQRRRRRCWLRRKRLRRYGSTAVSSPITAGSAPCRRRLWPNGRRWLLRNGAALFHLRARRREAWDYLERGVALAEAGGHAADYRLGLRYMAFFHGDEGRNRQALALYKRLLAPRSGHRPENRHFARYDLPPRLRRPI
jgi:hypothetical protein